VKQHKNLIAAVAAAFGIMVIIIDSKTAIAACADAADLCIRSIVPSLFPLFVLSILMTSNLHAYSLKFLSFLRKICRMPRNTEIFLLNGFLCGYPSGAQCVANAYESEYIARHTALRLLAFCNNAGPAFIFGVAGPTFQNQFAPWGIWLVQIISALITGSLLPATEQSYAKNSVTTTVTLSKAIITAIKALACVCGWILLFRCVCAYCEEWFLWRLPGIVQACFIGILELTNGCWYLVQIENEALRFCICSVLMAFGGICVIMQTSSVVGDLGIRSYISGKILQSILAIMLSVILSILIYKVSIIQYYWEIMGVIVIAGTLVFCMNYLRNNSRFSKNIDVYYKKR